MDFSKLHAKPKTYIVGKHLPESERVEITLYALSMEDLHLADFSGEKSNADQLAKLITMLSKMLRTTEDEVRQFSAEFFEEIMEDALDRMAVSDEKQKRIKTLLEEKQKKEVTNAG